MATLAFDAGAGVLRLESVHAPHTVEDVVANTGFDLGDVSGVGTRPEPTAEELAVLRGEVRARMIESGTYPDWARANLGPGRAA